MRTVIDEINEVIGGEATVGLIANFGGQKLNVPAKIESDGHRLVKAIGKDKARRLCEYMGGDVILVPSRYGAHGSSTLRKVRDQEIVRMAKSGHNRGDIATYFGLTTRMVQYILTDARRRAESKRAPST